MTDADLEALVEAARERQAVAEAQARREGGIYDEVLGRWVRWEGGEPKEVQE